MASSSPALRRLLVLIGSGPGIGVATASLFASKGFSVALLSRNAERLQEDAAKVRSSAAAAGEDKVKVETFPVDAANHVALRAALEAVHASLGPPEVVVYNAARVGFSQFGEFTPDELLDDFKVNGVGIYTASVWAMPYLVELASSQKGEESSNRHPSFLLSGSGINYSPLPPIFSLSMQKAAQSSLLKTLEQVFGPQGVHVARLDINGFVREDDEVMAPARCAEQHWRLSQQDRHEWEHVVNVGEMDALIAAMKAQGFI
ncbi:NADP(+)-dependent dehydrogenase [Apiospora marii]|uniref:NADP(+)-dependent dehydrogenase n=1 Tax=Apiospora marii TaxID=335849 RepID=UPI00313190C4